MAQVRSADPVRPVAVFDSHITDHGIVVKRGKPWMESESESGLAQLDDIDFESNDNVPENPV